MKKEFEIKANLKAGNKQFTVIAENNTITLLESGSIAAVIKETQEGWKLSTGSYNESDVGKIGEQIKHELG